MKSFIFFWVLSLHVVPAFSQTQNPTTYQALKAYEGVYEYRNQSSLKIAVSPKDNRLYALINFYELKIELSSLGNDLFVSKAQEKLQFYRDAANKVIGYRLDSTQFKLLSKHVSFPKELWYARLDTAKGYHYVQPKQVADGLPTGHVAQSGLDTALLNQMVRKISNGTYPNVHSVLVIKDGKLVFEEYFYEYTRDKLHELRSATKSVVSALVGIAIDKGYLPSTDVPVLSFFPDYAIANMTDDKKQITLEHLLTNQSGLDCDVTRSDSPGTEYKMNTSDDWVKFTLDLPMLEPPGRVGRYCSGNTILAGRMVEKQTRMALPDFAKQTLFRGLGIKNYIWNFTPDRSSEETICEVFLTSRDMAKFGLLYLNNGQWQGKQVISADWVKRSLSKHSVVQGVNYGYFWWLKYLDSDGIRYFGKAAQGNGGQKIFLWEEQNMVTVITGGNYNVQSPSDELIRRYILPTFNKKKEQ